MIAVELHCVSKVAVCSAGETKFCTKIDFSIKTSFLLVLKQSESTVVN